MAGTGATAGVNCAEAGIEGAATPGAIGSGAAAAGGGATVPAGALGSRPQWLQRITESLISPSQCGQFFMTPLQEGPMMTNTSDICQEPSEMSSRPLPA